MITRKRQPRWIAAVGIVLGAIASHLALSGAPASAQEASEVEITTGELVWGFKQSWRTYTAAEAQDGASLDEEEVATFPLTAGSYDPEQRTTRLEFGGSVRYVAHPEEEIYLLDVTLGEPHLVISETEQIITVEAISRELPSRELVDLGRVPIATLGVRDVEPVVGAETTSWSDIPSFITAEAADDIFLGQYSPGEVIDPVTFTYAGPGGAPDFSDDWQEPGTPRLELTDNRIIEDNPSIWYADEQRGLVHYTTTTGSSSDRTVTLHAFDLETMETVGNGLTFPTGELAPQIAFVDSGTGRIFVKPPCDTETQIEIDPVTGLPNVTWVPCDIAVEQYIQWDPNGREYVTGESTVPLVPNDFGDLDALWDPVGERAISIERRLPPGADPSAFTEWETAEWYLHTYRDDGSDTWVSDSYQLPARPGDANEYAYRREFGSVTTRKGVVDADGSIVLLGEVEGPVQRLEIGDDSVTVMEIPGTGNPSGDGRFTGLLVKPDGGLVMTRPRAGSVPGAVQEIDLAGTGSSGAQVGDRIELGEMQATRYAVDPIDGTIWAVGRRTQDLAAIRDGAVLYRQHFAMLHPDNPSVFVGRDHTVYAWTFDGVVPDLGAPTTRGIGRFERVGVSPTITEHPAAAATVADGEPGEATFTAAATGEPAPTVQWQVKPPGESRFTDIDGADDTSVTVEATAGDNGSQYRAVFSNTAGAIATEPATLTVEYPPSIGFQPEPVSVSAGEDAVFQVQATGNPEPVVRWQRLVDGSWDDVPSTADDYSGVSTPTLTVHDAALAQDGVEFRAGVSNGLGTVYSDAAMLMVTGGEPGDGEQQINVTVGGDGGPGEFVWSIDGDGRVDLGETTNEGGFLQANGELDPIVVSDTREGGQVWSVTGRVDDFSGDVPGSYLGWSPEVLSPGAGATAGDAVPSGFESGDGLSSSSMLADAQAGHDPGTATLGADLDLRLPVDTPADIYTATLTITALT